MKAKITTLPLTIIQRQKNITDGNILARIRNGSFTRSDLDRINCNVVITPPLGSTILAFYNGEAKRLNEAILERSDADLMELKEVRKGTCRKNEMPGLYAPLLQLKEHCRVIIKRNGRCSVNGVGLPYHNGETGRFLGIDKRESMLIERDDGEILKIRRYKYEDTTKREIGRDEHDIPIYENKVVGSISQYPISLAYAQSVHSSQGMTLKRVHVALPRVGDSFFRECPNLIYVAFSRVESLKSLTLSRPVVPSDIWTTMKDRDKPQQYEIWKNLT